MNGGGGGGDVTLTMSMRSVSSTATLMFQEKRSPRIRMRGPAMGTTLVLSDSGVVMEMTSPRPAAACSFSSGGPFKIPSRNIGRTGAIP